MLYVLYRNGDARMYMLELARHRLARKPMFFSSMLLFFMCFALTLATPFITLKMHCVICSSWLGIVLQRNEFAVQVSVGQENTPLYNMPATGGLVTTHQHTTNRSEIYHGPLQKPSAYLTRAHIFATTFSFMCGFDLLCTTSDRSFCSRLI